MPESLTNHWSFYLCKVNDQLASIYLNLGLRSAVPIVSKPWLLWIWVYFNSPRPDGLSSNEEAPVLYKIEDALTRNLSASCGALLAGRITTSGRREFYFYGENQDGFRNAVTEAMNAFAAYRFDIKEERDPLWEQYLDVLFPNERQMETIKNRRVLDVLEEHGDVHSVPRLVRHWIYFSTEDTRSAFRDAALGSGFTIDAERLVDGSEPFGLIIAREEPVDQNGIDRTVTELTRMAQQFGGDYDGWETQVVNQ